MNSVGTAGSSALNENLPLIPTLSRSKISHTLAYPIGTEALSTALREIAQFESIKAHFYYWSDLALRRGKYEFLRVEYLSGTQPAEQYPISHLYQRPPQYRWELVIQPVPRLLKHAIATYIHNTALPQIASWLSERANMSQTGSDILAFLFIEESATFEALQLSKLEPQR